MKNQAIKALAAAAIATSWAATASAAPKLNYLELSYGTGDLDISVSGLGSADIDQEGFKLEASVAPGDVTLLRASFASIDGDENGVDLETETVILGGAFLLQAGDTTAVDVGLEFRTDDLSVSAGSSSASDDIDGFGVSAGVHSMLAENFAVGARVSYIDGDYEGALTFDISGTFYVNENFGISVGYERLDADDDGVDLELQQFQLGARYSF